LNEIWRYVLEEKYFRIKEIVSQELSGSAHNMDHIMRVYNSCLFIAEDEPDINLNILKTAALLHDIARIKEDHDNTGDIDHAILGAEMAEKILRKFRYSEEEIEQIKHCISAHRFRSGNEPKTIEAKILFDADKLDVIGSVGIARTFIIAGEYGEKLYSDSPVDDYIKDNLVDREPEGRINVMSKHAPNLEYETKFKHIPSKLYTQKARKMAEQRLKYMDQFFKRMKKEIDGEL
jgi:uncharacterized protein